MAEEEDPDLAAAIRASLGLPPLPPSRLNNDQPLFLPSDDDDEEDQPQEDFEQRSASGSGSGGSEIPDFSDGEAVDRYFNLLNQHQAQAQPAPQPPPPAPPVAARRPPSPPPRRVPTGWNGAWRGQSRLLDDDDDGPPEEEEEGPDYRLALRRSREEEERRIAALRVPELVPDDVDGEDEEEMMRRAIEASMRPVTPPPAHSDEIDEEEEDRFNEELRKAIEESRRERERRGEGSAGGSAAAPVVLPAPPPAPLFQRPSARGDPNSNSSTTLASSSSSTSSSPPTTVAVAAPAPPPPPPAPAADTQPTASTSTASTSSSMFGGLSRADLEKERLARANKRQLTDDSNGASSSSSQQPPSKKPRPSNTTARIMTFGDLPKDGDDEDGAPSGGGGATGSAWGGGSGGGRGGGGGVERIGRGDRFFDGEKGYGFTTNNLCAAPGKYFGIRELIGDTSTLKLAIISTYCFEPELVASLFPTSVPTVLVSHPPAKEAAGKSFHGTSVPGIWSCYPYLPPWPGGGEGRFRGVCHMKFMLLFYDDGRLRVVIMSANFMAFDFKSIENGVWVQDFHPRTSQEVVKVDFGNQWEMILEALGIPATFRLINPVHHNLPFRQTSDIHNWDFSSIKVRLVASLGGKKEGWKAMEKVGQCRLGKVLRDEGWVPGDGRVLKSLEAQGSSLGNYSTKWMNDIFRNVSGRDPRSWLGRISKQQDSSYPPIKIIFPTLGTVDATVAGRNGGGTFFCDDKKWKEGTKSLFYSAEAKRGAVLMHIKMLVAIFEPSSLPTASSLSSNSKGKARAPPPEVIELSGSETEDEDGQPLSLSTKSTQPNGKGKEREAAVEVVEKRVPGWIYMGSHNFTPSAWGNLSMRKDGTPGQDGANYELGIIIPLTSDDPQAEANKLTTWKRPARRYTERDLPWMQYEHNLEGGHGVGRSD